MQLIVARFRHLLALSSSRCTIRTAAITLRSSNLKVAFYLRTYIIIISCSSILRMWPTFLPWQVTHASSARFLFGWWPVNCSHGGALIVPKTRSLRLYCRFVVLHSSGYKLQNGLIVVESSAMVLRGNRVLTDGGAAGEPVDSFAKEP